MDTRAYREAVRNLHSKKGVLAFTATKSKHLQGRKASPEELDLIQDELAPDLTLESPEDGCYARAQLLCQELREKDISHGKLFVHSTYKQLGKDDVRWNYHVAAVALAEDQGKVAPLVLDPLLSPDPMTPADWVQSFHRGGHVIAVLHSDRKYLNGVGGGSNFEENTKRALRRLEELRESEG